MARLSLGRAASATWFPVAIWAVWRLAHLLAVVAWGGDPVQDTFRFDGAWMRSVLDDGYVLSDPSFTIQQNVAFLPGVVALARPFAAVMDTDLAGLVVANLTGLTSFWALFVAVRAVSDERVARRAVVTLALWPGSLALWAFMSEGAFITASALAVLADARRRPLLAAIAAWAAGTTRVVGFTVGPALAVARVFRTRRIDRVAVGYVASGAASVATVVLVQHLAVGDGLAFQRAQQAWGRSISVPGAGVVVAGQQVVERLPHLSLELTMNLASVGVVGAALIVASIRLGFRGPAGAALVVAWAAFLIPLSSDLVASQVRYVMGAWAAVLVFSCVRLRSRLLPLVGVVVGVAASLVLSHRWVMGSFVA
ncbi:hypothetical protein [Iamia sp.]|uniref:hypothetical protein n=1 Tax=Iamia sp. TaxID=2722710 RepID=UPI002B66CBBD|nr:hypothetical protein [Iamia sp.]HXH58272.1 hypothetical protein [Iamia sp.]